MAYYGCVAKKNKRIAREQAEAERQKIEQQRRNDQMAGVRTNFAIVAMLIVLYFVRGGQFVGLGQLLALAICFFFAQITTDMWRIYRNEPEPAGLVRRLAPTLALTALLFTVIFLTMG